MSKYLQLAKKLHALAVQGIDGERENAQQMLNTLMAKHNITLADIEGEKTYYRKFYPKDEVQDGLLIYIIRKVVNNNNVSLSENRDKRTKRFTSANLTDAQFIEVQAMFDFYKLVLLSEMQDFFIAFVLKNKLYPDVTDTDRVELSQEDIERNRKLRKMVAGISDTPYHKQIN